MPEIPSQTPEIETECSSPSTPNVRKSSRKPVAKKLDIDPYEQYSHKWTLTDKTTLLKALKEFGPTDIDNISLKLPNKHPNQIKVFINNMKSKTRALTEYRIQRGLKNKMSQLKRVIKFIENIKNKSGKRINDDWFNPSLSMAMAIIKNMEEHPPATAGICVDYKEAYGCLEDILEFRGGNINDDIMNSDEENMWDIDPCEGQCDGHCHKWKMPDRAALLRVLEELAPIDSETQTSKKTKEAVDINEESNKRAQSTENKTDTENVNAPIQDKTQNSEKTEEAVNKESNNKAHSTENKMDIEYVNIPIEDKTQINEKTVEVVNVNQKSNNEIHSIENKMDTENLFIPIEDTTQNSEKTEEAVNEKSNNKAHSVQNKTDAENKMDIEYVNMPIEDKTQFSEKTEEAVNINEESKNKAHSTENLYIPIEDKTQISEKTEEAVNINEESNNKPQSTENVNIPIEAKTQASEKTKEAVCANEESNNKGQSNENSNEINANKNKDLDNNSQGSDKEKDSNKNNHVENAEKGKYIKIRQRAKEIAKKKKDAQEYARQKRYMANDEDGFSYRTKYFVLQGIYTVLKSSIFNFYELNAIIYPKTNEEIPGMYEFNADNPILTAKKEKAEAMLKSYLDQNIYNPLSLSRGTVTEVPKLLSHFLKYYKS